MDPRHLDSGVMQRHLATQGFATLLIDIARAAILMRAPSLKQDVTLAAARSQWLPKTPRGSTLIARENNASAGA
ncbi:hypothetical protein [Caulobacter sp.]|uniref:hypothetical protein n=1 Tax=Caulobacter sp. TaxID=78 RepID=UPI003BB11B29